MVGGALFPYLILKGLRVLSSSGWNMWLRKERERERENERERKKEKERSENSVYHYVQ